MNQQLWQWLLEPGNLTLIGGIVAAFAVGMITGLFLLRHRGRSLRSRTRKGDDAFFKGIQYILSNDQDQAIEEFTKSVQVNSDTVETYMALGNLYRSKGEIDRAIHIRQTIILRPHVEEEIRIRALLDMGLDYRKGGFLNRALETFLEVLKKRPSNLETLYEVEKIYEDLKDWGNAFSTRQKIAKLAKGDHTHIVAHHQTELGKVYFDTGEHSKAKAAFEKAIDIQAECIDAYLHLGDLFFSNQDYKHAIAVWKKVVQKAPRFTFLAYRRLEGAYATMKNLKPVEEFLQECSQFNSDAFTRLALARYRYNEQDYDGALEDLSIALKIDPLFWEARRFMGEILIEQARTDEALTPYEDLSPYLRFQYLEFQCANCGFKPTDLQWQCPQCRQWDTIDFMEMKSDTVPSQHHEQTMLPDTIKTESLE